MQFPLTMDYIESFSVPFSSLKPGKYRFDFLIEHPFFREFEFSTISEGRIWVNLEVARAETMMVLEFNFKGTVQLPCDRCLELFDLEIAGDRKLIVKFGEKTYEETDEVLVLSRAEHKLNVAQYIYEYILLAIPFKVIHPETPAGEPGCSSEALAAIEKASHPEQVKGSDPRWDALKKLKKAR